MFQSLIGDHYQPCPLPSTLSQEELDQTKAIAQRASNGSFEFICENYEKSSESAEFNLKNKWYVQSYDYFTVGKK